MKSMKATKAMKATWRKSWKIDNPEWRLKSLCINTKHNIVWEGWQKKEMKAMKAPSWQKAMKAAIMAKVVKGKAKVVKGKAMKAVKA